MRQTSCLGCNGVMTQYITDGCAAMIILLIGWVYTFGIEQILDITLFDESTYLHWGLLMPDILPCPDWSALYSVWYYLLSLVRSDPVQLYFLNYKLMTILPSIALYITLRAYSVTRIVSLVISLGFMFSNANFPTVPKVSHFAALILLFGFFFSSLFRDRPSQTAALLFATLFASYARPEYFLAFICLSVVFLFVALMELKDARSQRTAIMLIVTVPICVVMAFPIARWIGRDNRSMIAFGQHYAYNWAQWRHDDRNPWTNWKTIIARDFGEADSVAQALLTNPTAGMRHIVQNASSCHRELKSMFSTVYPNRRPTSIGLKLGVAFLALAAIVAIRRNGLTEFRERLQENWAFLSFRLTLLLLILLPGAVSTVLIGPRRHYFYLIGCLALFGCAALLFRSDKTGKEKEDTPELLVLALIGMAVLFAAQPLSISAPGGTQPNLKTIQFIRSLNVSVPVKLLEAEGGYSVYLGANYDRVAEDKKSIPFKDFLEEQSINMIVLSDELRRDVRFRDDPQWRSFLNNPSSFGFTRLAIPHVSERSLLAKREIIKACSAQ